MLVKAIRKIKTSLILLMLFTVLTGLIYPAVVTCLAQLFFPWQANGSFIENKGKVVGSLLIGQSFTNPKYFYGRPSATTPFPFNAESSSGSNLGPSNPELLTAVKARVANLQKENSGMHPLIPVDLVTASGSGLDPEISPLAAFYQVPRIAKARRMAESGISKLVSDLIQNRTLGILGEPRVNVLQLNLALDNLKNSKDKL